MSRETVTSIHGTSIAYWRSGEGPPLVLVHGTAADHSRWRPILPAFEQRFTVCAVDRRGRGGSGDSDDYAIEREFEDIAAVVDSLGEPAHVLGHSHGALCALGAALLTRNVRKLVLYEPPVNVAADEGILPPGVIDRLEALLEAGDRDGVVATMLRGVAGATPEVVQYMRAQPAWQARVSAAHTVPRELRVPEAYRVDLERFGDLRVPTLLLKGGESPATFEEGEKAVAEALPNCRIVVMPGQGHVAMDTATHLFTSEVLRFLVGPREGGLPQAPAANETALFIALPGRGLLGNPLGPGPLFIGHVL
jgi:pimeloyl-ACP methyl ester carboxylesterase